MTNLHVRLQIQGMHTLDERGDENGAFILLRNVFPRHYPPPQNVKGTTNKLYTNVTSIQHSAFHEATQNP